MCRGTAIVEYRAAVGKLTDGGWTTERLRAAWQLFCVAHPARSAQLFVRVVNLTTQDDEACDVCAACGAPEWQEDGYTDVDCNFVCDLCRGNYRACDRCEEFSISGRRTTTVGYQTRYCEECRDSYCSHCDNCDTWYVDESDDAAEHDHEDEDSDEDGCDCAPHELHFQILANSHGVLHQDERLLVTLPQGDVTDEAVRQVVQLLWDAQFSGEALAEYGSRDNRWVARYTALDNAIRSLPRMWQSREGNYTKRVSKVLYQQLNAKLDPGLLSRVGSTVRDYSGRTNSWHVEFTRDLNQSSAAFYHEGSCWWGEYSRSRCALKQWGGLALRTYQSADQCQDMPSGRAWIQPLNAALRPTADIHGAHAYVVYNGYGDLDGYTPARLLAYLTSRTYKKIEFSASAVYVNSGGYLVADQATCDATNSITINHDYHQKVSA